jgi:hypothetical protein
MAQYDYTKLPSGANALLPTVESGLTFNFELYQKIAGTRTVIEVSGGQPIPATDYSFFRATDGKLYMTGRFRVPVDENFMSNGKVIWQSTLQEVTPSSLPAGYGGV